MIECHLNSESPSVPLDKYQQSALQGRCCGKWVKLQHAECNTRLIQNDGHHCSATPSWPLSWEETRVKANSAMNICWNCARLRNHHVMLIKAGHQIKAKIIKHRWLFSFNLFHISAWWSLWHIYPSQMLILLIKSSHWSHISEKYIIFLISHIYPYCINKKSFYASNMFLI